MFSKKKKNSKYLTMLFYPNVTANFFLLYHSYSLFFLFKCKRVSFIISKLRLTLNLIIIFSFLNTNMFKTLLFKFRIDSVIYLFGNLK